MATLQYIGARYVPTFYLNSLGTPEWESGVAYEPLTIVTYNNNSYTSRKPVPAEVGNPSANPEYWAQTGVYNAQIGQLQNDVADLQQDVADIEEENKKMYWYTPEMFGAVGDVNTDDTAAIQEMFDTIPDYSTVVFSKRYYKISSEIYIRKNFLRITGGFSGAEYGSIIYSQQTSGSFFVVYGVGCEFYGMMWQGIGRGSTLATAVLFDQDNATAQGNTDCVFRNCTIYAVEYGIRVLGRNLNVSNCSFSALRKAITFEQTNISTELRGHWIHGCRFHGCSTGVTNNITNLLFKNVEISSNVVDGGGAEIFSGYSGNVNIFDNIIHVIPDLTGGGNIITMLPGAGAATEDVHDVVSNNIMHINGRSYGGVDIRGGIKAVVKGNYIEGSGRRGIFIEAGASAIVDGNVINNNNPSLAVECAATATGIVSNNIVTNSTNRYSLGNMTSYNNN